MKITLSKDLLHDKLNIASRFTSTKLTTVNTLQGVLLKGEKNKIHLYTTDLTVYFHTLISTDSENDFEIILEPKKIVEFLQFLNPGSIEIIIKEKQVTISQDKTKGNFPVITSVEFPLPPKTKIKQQKIDITLFKKNLPLILFATSHDETRPALTGVNFVVVDEELILVATDGFRLSLIKMKKQIELSNMLVPGSFLTELLRYGKDEKEIGFSYISEEKMIAFFIGETTFYSRLIEGDFPPYERVIPTEVVSTVTLEREELLRNIKLISVFARESSHVVVCEFKKDGLYVRPKKDSNADNTAYQEIQLKGAEQTVAFNYRFMLDLLNNLDTKTLQIEILRPDAPIVFKAEKNQDFLHIIMPVRIQE
ncbi:DNA polymerase III subunit beta [Candidatus Roizmanbacteria bacterium]|nr:DNA polymerase III subunit beta [Candidatus Roizmanbacteria bacterium]